MNITPHSPVVLVHGFPGGSSDWSSVQSRLRTEATVAVDLIGFGELQGPAPFEELWVDAQVARLIGELDAAGVRAAVLAAHDFGVPVAVMLALSRPDLVSHLVLMSGNVRTDAPLAPPMRLIGKPIIGALARRALFSRAANRWMATTKTSGTQQPRENTPDELQAIATIFGTALTDIAGYFGPIEQAASQLTAPVTLIWGRRDPFFPASYAEQIGQTLGTPPRLLEGVGHYPHIERPDVVAEAINQAAVIGT